jgi:hypothetical protein
MGSRISSSFFISCQFSVVSGQEQGRCEWLVPLIQVTTTAGPADDLKAAEDGCELGHSRIADNAVGLL